MLNTKQKKLLDNLIERNEEDYNLKKLGEECLELGLIINQFYLKSKEVDFQKIIDEIGDVKIRLQLLLRKFKKFENNLYGKVLERINLKLINYQNYIDQNKYKNI